MKKLIIILGVIHILLAIIMTYFDVVFIIEIIRENNGWTELGMLIVSMYASILALVLLIPMIVFLLTIKYKNMKLYFYSYLTYAVLSVLSLLSSILYMR